MHMGNYYNAILEYLAIIQIIGCELINFIYVIWFWEKGGQLILFQVWDEITGVRMKLLIGK